jgi:hypothetical protein
MYFEELRQELIEIARERVHSGEFSERRLARLCDVSQSHMHNVFSGIRQLSAGCSDALMRVLDIEIPDLIWRVSMRKHTAISIVPMVRGRVGPGADADLSSVRGYVPLPGSLMTGLVQPVAALLGPDLAMPRELASLDLILLDQNPLLREAPAAGLWVITEGSGLRARRLALENSRLCSVLPGTGGDPARHLSIPLQGRHILDIVRARIVWMGREMEKTPARPADAAGERHRGDR